MLNVLTNQMAHDFITNEFVRFKRDKTSREARIRFAHDLVESFFAITGDIPSTSVLDRLATLILQDELADRNEHKMSQNERPLLSERQQERRHSSERSMKAAQDVAVDGTDYRIKTRDSNRKLREIFG